MIETELYTVNLFNNLIAKSLYIYKVVIISELFSDKYKKSRFKEFASLKEKMNGKVIRREEVTLVTDKKTESVCNA